MLNGVNKCMIKILLKSISLKVEGSHSIIAMVPLKECTKFTNLVGMHVLINFVMIGILDIMTNNPYVQVHLEAPPSPTSLCLKEDKACLKSHQHSVSIDHKSYILFRLVSIRRSNWDN